MYEARIFEARISRKKKQVFQYKEANKGAKTSVKFLVIYLGSVDFTGRFMVLLISESVCKYNSINNVGSVPLNVNSRYK